MTSVSLWDTLDPAGLQEWLNENLGTDCNTVLHEVGGGWRVRRTVVTQESAAIFGLLLQH